MTDHVSRNRAVWDTLSEEWVEPGRRAWESAEPTWGIWGLPERDVRALPTVSGKDVVELGCGAAYWSAWLARQGARVVGLDNSGRQLATAWRLQREYGLTFPLIHADAEQAPLASAAFDLALSEYGASIWCDPYRWIPEAARLLRPGGELVFSSTARCWRCARPTATASPAPACSATTSGCTGSSGRPMARWNSRCRSASGSVCSAPVVSKSST